MIKIIASLGVVLLLCLELNAQVNVSSEMMPFNVGNNVVVDSAAVIGSNLESVSDQKMPFRLSSEAEEKNKNRISEDGQSLPEKASEKILILPPKEE